MIHVVVPVFNCYSGLVSCLGSLYAQVGTEVNVVVIDDASTDPRVPSAILQFCERQGWTALVNEVNRQCPWNLCMGIEAANADPHDIIFVLDGDDWLPHPRVLAEIVQVYEDSPATWLTYGSYMTVPRDPEAPRPGWYPLEVVADRAYRRHGLTMFNHPITFKKFLWDALDPDTDFRFPNGDWMEGVYDEAMMYPMLEMATNHYQFLSEVRYVYNSGNPLSVKYSMPERVRRAGEFLRSLPKRPLMRLDGDVLVEED